LLLTDFCGKPLDESLDIIRKSYKNVVPRETSSFRSREYNNKRILKAVEIDEDNVLVYFAAFPMLDETDVKGDIDG
jgi:hypothetical protein